MIPDLRAKHKEFFGSIPRDVLILILLILVAAASFGLEYLTGEGAAAQTFVRVGSAPDVATSSDGLVVASRNGGRYYLPWCAGAARIADANRVWFESEAQARASGYAPARNCDGL